MYFLIPSKWHVFSELYAGCLGNWINSQIKFQLKKESKIFQITLKSVKYQCHRQRKSLAVYLNLRPNGKNRNIYKSYVQYSCSIVVRPVYSSTPARLLAQRMAFCIAPKTLKIFLKCPGFTHTRGHFSKSPVGYTCIYKGDENWNFEHSKMLHWYEIWK